MNGWGNLGVVDTIFEEEVDDDLHSLSSPPLSSPSSPLQSCVDAWTAATGRKPDVKIHVQGICFHLHKDPLISKSSYLKRQLIGVSDFTLSPPLKISSDTFKQIADYSYSGHVIITPFNFAALRTAAEILNIDSGGGNDGDDDNLIHRTESYFCMVVAPNKEFLCSVFRSCLTLLPEAEQTAFLASRCIEALFEMEEDGGCIDGVVGCAEELKVVAPEQFKVIVESMQRRFSRSHDLLYRVVDLYFLVYNGKITEDQKTQICSTIDCSILSSALLMHAVQNHHMPLRFIVQAMLIEQLNTHRTIFTALNSSAATNPTTTTQPHLRLNPSTTDHSPATLGAILERDAALRQVAQLRAAIDTTSSKIQTLERELSGMKKLLVAGELDKEKEEGRSSSCRFNNNSVNKVLRGERGSVSFSLGTSYRNQRATENDRTPKRSLGQRLIRGLKMAVGMSLSNKDERERAKESFDGEFSLLA